MDLVLDMPSLVRTLSERCAGAIFRIDWQQAQLLTEGRRALLQVADCTVRPQRLLLTAGTGNEALIRQLGGQQPAMQRRPLQQVLVKHEYRERLYAHCTGASTTPRLTISSHRTIADEPVWYLGGELADSGTDDPPEVLIDRARRELNELLPWIEFGHCEWGTLKLDRAEPRQSSLLRPDQAFVGKVDAVDNALAAWPTKLTLSPNLADEIELSLRRDGVVPGPAPDLSPLASLPAPGIAPTSWDQVFS